MPNHVAARVSAGAKAARVNGVGELAGKVWGRMWLYSAILLAAAVCAILAGRASGPQTVFNGEINLSAADTVLVFAPHCDDEVLGVGGLIHTALENGSRVKVVLVTNGDGFPVAAGLEFRQVRLTAARYIELAGIRQRESLAALAALGLGPEEVIFLGYPDRGIAHLWLENWGFDRPYQSRYTKLTASPYPDSFRPAAPYCGAALAEDVSRIIRETRPTKLILPHPNDAHPDHWATYNFVRYAMEDIRETDRELADGAELYHYVVHRGKWPYPKGLKERAEIFPPRSLAGLDTAWVQIELSPETVFAKYMAIMKYRSQLAVMLKYLVSFARRNEIFALLPPASIPVVADGQIVVDGQGDDWEGIAALITEPGGDTLIRRVQRSTDIIGVSAARDSRQLYFRLEMRGRLSRFITYCLHLRLFGGSSGADEEGQRVDIFLRLPGRVTVRGDLAGDGKVAGRMKGKTVEAAVPLAGLGGAEKIFFGAETMLGFIHADQTAWQVISLAAERTGVPGAE